jgi:hypothetical protein
MTRTFKKITFILLFISALALSGLARPGDYWATQKEKKKPPERLPEKKKEGRRDDRKDEDGKKGKKP